MKSPWSLLPLATLMACASAGNSTRETPRPTEGTYEFFASVPGQTVRGTFRLQGENISIDDQALDCGTAGRRQEGSTEWARATAMASSASRNKGAATYRGCDGVSLAFDAKNPVQSKWYAAVPVQRRRQVCAERVVQNGREVCVRQKMETYEAFESRSGSLQVRRVSN
jgi:hypothetical protein